MLTFLPHTLDPFRTHDQTKIYTILLLTKQTRYVDLEFSQCRDYYQIVILPWGQNYLLNQNYSLNCHFIHIDLV